MPYAFADMGNSEFHAQTVRGRLDACYNKLKEMTGRRMCPSPECQAQGDGQDQ